MTRWWMLALVGSWAACSNGSHDDSSDDDGNASGGAGNAASSGTSGASTGGASGTSQGGTGATGGTGGPGGASGASDAGGTSGQAGSGGSAGATGDFVPLPPGSRELDGIVNLVDAAAAAELDEFLIDLSPTPFWEGGLTLALNLFLERYVEEYDFVYFVTDHPVDTNTIGRFENVTQPASPGIGNDYDWEREGYKTNGKVRGVIGVQWGPEQYGPLGHEMLHYWANNLDPSFGFGVGLSENAGSHWGYAGIHGVLGGFDRATLRCETPAGAMPPCTTGASGRTRYVVDLFFPNDNGVATPCDPFELYLMGLMPLAEVPATIPVFDEGEALYDTYDEALGTIVVEANGINTVAVSDIVARHGTAPELPASERAFRAAFVVLSATPAPDAMLGEVVRWASIHGNREAYPDILSFEALTGGRATLDTRLGARRAASDPPPAVRIPSACDVYEQDCGAGRACFFDVRTLGVCGLSRGGMRDAPCDESIDCAPGFDCVGNEAGTNAACEPYCNPDETATDACATMCPWYSLTDENDVAVAGICQAP